MSLLYRTGWYGKDALLGVTWDEEDACYRLLLTHRQKGRVEVVKYWKAKDTEELRSILRKQGAVPIILSLSLSEMIEKPIPAHTSDVIAAVLGVSMDQRNEVITQTLPQGEDKWVSLIRKDDLDPFLETLGEHQKKVIGINLTPATMGWLIPAKEGYSSQESYHLSVLGRSYGWKGNLLADIPPQSEEVSTYDLSQELGIEMPWMPLYSALVFAYVYPERLWLTPETTSQTKEVELISKWTKAIGWAGGGILILLLLGLIFIGFMHWRERSGREAIVSNQAVLQRIAENETRIENLQSFVGVEGKEMMGRSRVTYYLDRIASLVPKEVILTTCIFKPNGEDLKSIDRVLEKTSPDMVISGAAQNSVAISTFSLALEQADFVKGADLLKTEYDFQSEINTFILTIQLDL